jgi:long-chain fatty acid transport protein
MINEVSLLRRTFLVLLSVCPLANATDGYFSNGYGTQCKGLAGACTALSLDSMATAINPAGMLGAGRRYDLGVNFFNPNRDFTVTGDPSGAPGTFGLAPGKVSSASPLFLLPSFGMNFLRGRESSIGLSLYANGGLNTNYRAPVYGQAPTGVDARQIFLTPTFAHRFGGRHTLGVAPVVAYQEFKASGLESFTAFSSDPKNLTNNGWSQSFGFGVRAGYLGQLTSWLTIGAAYRSLTKMQTFAKYSGLFAGQGGFDIPAAYNFGVAAKVGERLTLSGDAQRTLYSSIPSVGNPMLPNLVTAKLGTNDGAGFGWRDLTVVRLGAQVTVNRNWTLRAGVSESGQTIPPSEVLLNILTPAVIRTHVTFGVTRRRNSRALHLAVVRALSNSVTGPNSLELPGRQSITLHMDQWEVEAGMTFGGRR